MRSELKVNREIKFRAKAVETEQWIIGLPRYSGEDWNDILDEFENKETGFVELVYPETVSQFTGLKDKNGVDIYEGDIFKEIYCPIGSNPKAVEWYQKGTIVYSGWSFGFRYERKGMRVLDESLALSWQSNNEEDYRHPTTNKKWTEDVFIDFRFSRFKTIEIIGNIHTTQPIDK